MADNEALIDGMNPLGYDPYQSQKFDSVENICCDFNHTLAWVFWQCGVAMNNGGNFEMVRHLRHLVLMGIQKKHLELSKIKTLHYDFDVEIKKFDNLLGIIISQTGNQVDENYSHVLPIWVIDNEALVSAIILNRELRETPKESFVSPFGPNDIVYPGNFDYSKSKGILCSASLKQATPTRTIRVAPVMSKTFQVGVNALNGATNIYQIQLLMSKLGIIDMTFSEFTRFLHIAAVKTVKFNNSLKQSNITHEFMTD